MAQVGLKSLLVAMGIIFMFLFATGIVRVKSKGYACAGGWDTGFRERVELVNIGFLHVYAFPLTRECDEERRYNPDDVQSCVDTGFCRIDEANSV